MTKHILILDDEPVLRRAMQRFFGNQGYEVSAFEDWEKARDFLQQKRADLLLVDLMLPRTSGIEVIKTFLKIQPDLVSIIMTGYGSISTAVEAIRAGAYHYCTKPFELDDIGSLVAKAIEHSHLKKENHDLKAQIQEKFGFENIVGQSAVMKEVFSMTQKIADTDSTVMITGESGTGKELLAHAIHCRSRRSDGPFIAVNCAAIPEGLLESELFGHTRGAFTGAVSSQAGKFEMANQGTLFLDEVGDMSPSLQVKVLRVLQERKIQPLGSPQTREVNIRIIAATHQDLKDAIQKNIFREDLYYRLNVIPIHIPPLRERKEDIPLLTKHFLKKHNERNQKEVSGFSEEAMDLLSHQRWPGNIRELENLVERLVVTKGTGTLTVQDFPTPYHAEPSYSWLDRFFFPDDGINFRDIMNCFENELIRKALVKSGENKNRAAQLLHINRTTLIEKMKRMRDAQT